jgi:hypothetical protein
MFDFDAESPDELSVKEGSVVCVSVECASLPYISIYYLVPT